MKNIYITLLIFSTVIIHAQDNWGNQWILGGSSSGEGIFLNFNDSMVNVSLGVSNIWMEGSNTSMCDQQGNLLFYSNGCFIANANHQVVSNGEDISPGILQDIWCPSGGNPTPQGVISIPNPGNANQYYLFSLDLDDVYFGTEFFGVAPINLYYHLIDMTLDNGLGEVILKNQIAIQDTLGRGNISAVRHANGEDWWLVTPKSHSNCYYITLINSDGIQPAFTKCIGHIWNDDDSGQAVFSPDKKTYVRMNYQNGLNIYKFDNANGDLYDPLKIDFLNDTFPLHSGVAISPNSRYLYTSTGEKLYQYDLFNENMEESRVLVAEWDGYSNPFPTIFNFAALAPDGKIYIASTSSTLNLHVIHKPNCPGLQCEVEQHGIELPAYNYVSIPNIPHYNLMFPTYDCDSTISHISNVDNYFGYINVYPNPASNYIKVATLKELSNDGELLLFTQLGQEAFRGNLPKDKSEFRFEIGQLSAGLYFYMIMAGREQIEVGKMMITR